MVLRNSSLLSFSQRRNRPNAFTEKTRIVFLECKL